MARLSVKTDLFESFFLPARCPSDDGERRLMIVLHGRGDSLRPFKKFDVELGLPDVSFLLLNGNRKLGRSGFSWCGLKSPVVGLKRTRALMTELLDDLIAEGWKASNIFLFGFSEGCLVGCDVAMSYPRRLGGVIGVSGCIYLAPSWKRRLAGAALRTPWLFTHGISDRVIRIETMRNDAKKLRRAGLSVDWVELVKRHEIEAETELPMIQAWVRSRRTLPVKTKQR